MKKMFILVILFTIFFPMIGCNGDSDENNRAIFNTKYSEFNNLESHDNFLFVDQEILYNANVQPGINENYDTSLKVESKYVIRNDLEYLEFTSSKFGDQIIKTYDGNYYLFDMSFSTPMGYPITLGEKQLRHSDFTKINTVIDYSGEMIKLDENKFSFNIKLSDFEEDNKTYVASIFGRSDCYQLDIDSRLIITFDFSQPDKLIKTYEFDEIEFNTNYFSRENRDAVFTTIIITEELSYVTNYETWDPTDNYNLSSVDINPNSPVLDLESDKLIMNNPFYEYNYWKIILEPGYYILTGFENTNDFQLRDESGRLVDIIGYLNTSFLYSNLKANDNYVYKVEETTTLFIEMNNQTLRDNSNPFRGIYKVDESFVGSPSSPITYENTVIDFKNTNKHLMLVEDAPVSGYIIIHNENDLNLNLFKMPLLRIQKTFIRDSETKINDTYYIYYVYKHSTVILEINDEYIGEDHELEWAYIPHATNGTSYQDLRSMDNWGYGSFLFVTYPYTIDRIRFSITEVTTLELNGTGYGYGETVVGLYDEFGNLVRDMREITYDLVLQPGNYYLELKIVGLSNKFFECRYVNFNWYDNQIYFN